MSVTTPDLFETVESKDADTKVIFAENEYITHPFHIEENLVVGEEIVVGENNQTEITTYFEQSIEDNSEMIDEEQSTKDSTLPNDDQNSIFFKGTLESSDEMDIEVVTDSTVSSEGCIDEKQEYISEDMLTEEEENGEVQEKEQKVILLNTSDGEQLFILYQPENEETEENIDTNNLHFVTEEVEEELVDDETINLEQKSEQCNDILQLEESEVSHKDSAEVNEQMDTKNGFIIDTSFPENDTRDNCASEDQTNNAKVPRALTYYFPGDMSYNDVSQSISLLKSKKDRKCDEDSDRSPSEIDHQQEAVNEQTTDDPPLSSSSTTEVQTPTTANQIEQRPQGRRRPRKQKLLDRGDDEMVFVPKWKVEAEEQSAYIRRNRARNRKKSHIAKRNIRLNKLRMKRRMKAKQKIEIIDLTGDDNNDEDKENEIVIVNLASDDEKEEQEKKPVKRRRIRRRKRFTCKHCSETFAMVTALARHVKAIHLQKRTRRRRINCYQKIKTKP